MTNTQRLDAEMLKERYENLMRHQEMFISPNNAPDTVIPDLAGVYVCLLGEDIVYVGESTDLRRQIYEHKNPKLSPAYKWTELRQAIAIKVFKIDQGGCGFDPSCDNVKLERKLTAYIAALQVKCTIMYLDRKALVDYVIREVRPIFNKSIKS